MSTRRTISLWAPVIACMVAIFVASGRSDLPVPQNVSDKVLHAGAYAVFGFLCLRAFHGGAGLLRARPAFLGILLTLAQALTDEWHQSWVVGREASVGDLAADALGAGIALVGTALLARWKWAEKKEPRTP